MSLDPITRKEKFLAKAGGQDVVTPTPITREEMFLSEISGGGGNGGVVQADYAVNDSESAGYIKNRPCYAAEETISWDGNSGGLVSFTSDKYGAVFVRVSDLTPSAEGLVGCNISLTTMDGTDEVTMSTTVRAEDIIENNLGRAVLVEGSPAVVVADKAGDAALDIPFFSDTATVSAAGIYVMGMITSFTMSGFEIVQKLAPKFLPAGPDYAVNDPEAEGFIANRPCYIQEETINWDGSTEGRETFTLENDLYVRVSELTPTTEELIGKTLTIVYIEGNTDSIPIVDSLSEGENCRAIAGGLMIVADKAGELSTGGSRFTAPVAGTYSAATKDLTWSIDESFEAVHKLDAKYLPDDYINSLIEAKLKALGLI